MIAVAQLKAHQGINQPVIEQAKGMLMGAFGLSDDHAFDLLKSVSPTNNVKLRTVAAHIVECWTAGGPRPEYDEAADFLVALVGRDGGLARAAIRRIGVVGGRE
ncbi:MAG: ANTAR domain-containing protein [Mycobacterium sp.]